MPVVALAALIAGACDGGPSAPVPGGLMRAEIEGLAAPDPATEGAYELWSIDDAGTATSLGRVAPDAALDPLVMEFVVPETGTRRVVLTLEPPSDDDGEPSRYALLEGVFEGESTALGVGEAITDGRPFVEEPGHHSLFTTSNNYREGYPSFEDAGIWMFSIYLSVNPHGSREVKLTPLQRAWVYEGWVVYRPGTADEAWISYGKFRPDLVGLLTSRDNTGSGPFSGDEDFRNGGVEDVPGDEWTKNPFGLDVPGGFELPLDLDAVDPVSGEAVWYHAITVEPAFDEAEPLTTEKPFVIRPYMNPIGEGRPGDPRRIIYRDNDPRGVVSPVR